MVIPYRYPAPLAQGSLPFTPIVLQKWCQWEWFGGGHEDGPHTCVKVRNPSLRTISYLGSSRFALLSWLDHSYRGLGQGQLVKLKGQISISMFFGELIKQIEDSARFFDMQSIYGTVYHLYLWLAHVINSFIFQVLGNKQARQEPLYTTTPRSRQPIIT